MTPSQTLPDASNLLHWPEIMARLLCFLFVLAAVVPAEQPADPLAVYKSGDYTRALPLLQQAVAGDPKDPALEAALLSVLVYQDRVDNAADLANADAQNFPQSPEVLAARGEFAFYMGDMPAAETLFKSALRIKDETARAYYGLYRIYYAASMYKSARLFCLRAHALDPGDALITRSFIYYLVPEKRHDMLPDFISSHPWFYGPRQQQAVETGTGLKEEINGRKLFEPDGPRQEVTIPLVVMFAHTQAGAIPRGVGIKVSIGDNKPFSVLLDTGASGITLKQSAIDRAGLTHVGSSELAGIGDKGTRKTFFAVADSCAFGALKFKACVIQATEGKRGLTETDDGLIGADVFSDYIVTLDFQKRVIHLVPLPERPPNPQGYNREPLPSEAGFTPVFRFGHRLEVSTTVNDKATGLFLLDTGASRSNIDSTFGRLTTKVHRDSTLRIYGVSGEVKDVFEASKAELQFARFRQKNLGITAIDLNTGYFGHEDCRMDGILGLPLLVMFRLSIDYRNGLVNFDYTP